MSTWSPAEFDALFQAWEEAIDTPLRERAKISHEVFRRFTMILGGTTTRSEGSVSFKQGSLKNMAQLVMAFGDHDVWFEFSHEQKKQWFKMVNRKSYKFVDLDRATFHAVERLIQLQAVSKNMRTTTASAVPASTSVRVTLRRNPIDGAWEVQGAPLQAPAARVIATSSDTDAPAPQVYATRRTSGTSRHKADAEEDEDARPRPRVREFPFPPPTATAARPVASDARSIFAPLDAPATSGHKNDVVLFDMGDYDSDSSSESDSDEDLMEDSEAVAAQLKLLEARDAQVASPVLAPVERPSAPVVASLATRPVLSPRWNEQPRDATPSVQKRSPMAAALHAMHSAGHTRPAKKRRSDAPLLSIVATLETQAQEFTALLTEAKAARARDASRQAANAVDTQALEREMQTIMDAIELEHAIRRSEQAQRAAFEADKRRILAELARFRDERAQFDKQQRADDEARRHFLEQLATDRDERRKFAEACEVERKEREAFVALLARESAQRQHFSEKSTDRPRLVEKKRSRPEDDDVAGPTTSLTIDQSSNEFAEQENTEPPREQTPHGWTDPSASATKTVRKDALDESKPTRLTLR